MWMGASPMLALGNVELIGVENTLSHGRKKEAQEGKEEIKNDKNNCYISTFCGH